jgi:hypothetical protein
MVSRGFFPKALGSSEEIIKKPQPLDKKGIRV